MGKRFMAVLSKRRVVTGALTKVEVPLGLATRPSSGVVCGAAAAFSLSFLTFMMTSYKAEQIFQEKINTAGKMQQLPD